MNRTRHAQTRAPVTCMLLGAAALSAIAPGAARADPSGAPAGAPRVWIAGEGARVRSDDVASPLARGDANWAWRPGAPIRLAALRAEVVAFQVIVEAGGAPLEGVRVDVAPLVREAGAPQAPRPDDGRDTAAAPPSIERFVEHYVEVKARSRNERRPEESLGWAPGARPPDDDVLGWVPDAIVPIEAIDALDAGRDAAPARLRVYPLAIAPRRNGAVWIDVTVPESAAPGVYAGVVEVGAASHGELARFDLRVEVADAVLPYRPVSFLAYYDPYEMAERLGDATRRGTTASEPQVWQLLHRHHVDAFASLRTPEDTVRLAEALDGTLFTPESGYRGPGEGVPPAAVALGAYGTLGDPSPEAMRRVEDLVPHIPREVDDVILYAVDEDCESARGPGWRRLVRRSPVARRVRVAHSCHEDPRKQDVDLVLMPAQRFDLRAAREARAMGKELWIYNGALPHAGTLLLDAPTTALTADGWIAAAYPVGRWFLWETAFWHDGNRGGRGPIDPFTVPENFHNKDGDACLGDGMLLYPGTQAGKFADRSLGLQGVLPSMRLKALRRGIQDAGYVALARAARPSDADAILARVVPAALDDAREDGAAAWPTGGAAFAEARDALRALVPAGATLDRRRAERLLAGAAAARASRRLEERADHRKYAIAGAFAAAALVLGGLAAWMLRRARRRPLRRRAGIFAPYRA